MDMDEATPVEIHCSQLVKWTTCEASALWELMSTVSFEPKEPHVATWIGSAVHAAVAGEPIPEPPDMMVYDEVTPTRKIAEHQVEKMRKAVVQTIYNYGWTVLRSEAELKPVSDPGWLPQLRITGRMDILAADRKGRHILADIKTRREYRATWLQTGGYVICVRDAGVRVDEVAAIHAPRSKFLNPQNVGIVTNDATDCAEMAMRAMNRISELIEEQERAVAAPGNRCRWCEHPRCPVRARENEGEETYG